MMTGYRKNNYCSLFNAAIRIFMELKIMIRQEPGVAGYRFCFPEFGKISDAFIALQERLARLYYYSTKMGNTNRLVFCSGQIFREE